MWKAVLLFSALAVVSWATPAPRIIGGKEIAIEEVPYNAAVMFLDYFLCGGVILTEKYVLTAGSCLSGVQTYLISVIAGTVDYRKEEDAQHSYAIEFHINPDYLHPSKNGDFGIIELKTPLIFNEKVNSIQIASEPAKAGAKAFISGWGDEDFPIGHLSKVLMITDVTIVEQETCKDILGGRGYTENMICAGDMLNGGKDFCEYDTGGPLVVDGKLVAIASWGLDCGKPGYPGAYTNILNYMEYINHVISK